MDRDFTVEKHLLSRCFTSEQRILELLEERYAVGGAKPFLQLAPTDNVEETKPKKEAESLFNRNPDLKPSTSRKVSTRRDMRVYIKRTLGNQRKAVAQVQRAARKKETIDIEALVKRYEVPVYRKYLPLSALWRQYMLDLLFGDQKNPNLNMILPKLATADFNGCRLTVLEARDRNLVGKTGIVLYDAQHLFIMVVPQQTESERTLSPAERVGGLRVVTKKGAIFGFEVEVEAETVGFSILGSRFELRAVDRSSKKFKSHNVEDIY